MCRKIIKIITDDNNFKIYVLKDADIEDNLKMLNVFTKAKHIGMYYSVDGEVDTVVLLDEITSLQK